MHSVRIVSIFGLVMFIMVGCNAKTDKPASSDEKSEPAANTEIVKADSDVKAPEAKADGDVKAPEAKADGEAKAPEANGEGEVKAPEANGEGEAKAPEANGEGEANAPEANGEGEAKGQIARRERDDFPGDSFFNLHYVHGDSTGVVCEKPEGCDCGGIQCPMNAECGHKLSAEDSERCMCGKTPVGSEYSGYVCMEVAKGVYDLGCTEKDGCPCGKIKVYSNMGCDGEHATCAGSPVPGRGLSCSHKPYENWLYSLNCFNDECDCYGETIHKGDVCPPLECERGFEPSVIGCACGGHKDDGKSQCVLGKDGKHVSYCTSSEGCECGDETCPMGAVCYHKKCVDRTTLKPIPEGYELSFGVPKCVNETCACGKKGKCQQGKYCLDGICYSDPYRRKLLDSKTYYYHLFSKDLVDAGPKEKYRNDIWSLMFVGLVHPDNDNEFELICNYFNSVKVKGSDEDICLSNKYQNGETTINEMLMHCGLGEIPEKVAAMYCTLDVVNGALQFSGWQDE